MQKIFTNYDSGNPMRFSLKTPKSSIFPHFPIDERCIALSIDIFVYIYEVRSKFSYFNSLLGLKVNTAILVFLLLGGPPLRSKPLPVVKEISLEHR